MIGRIFLLWIILMILSACNANPPSVIAYRDLPAEGDPARGETLFSEQVNLAPACSSCHNDTATASPLLVGFGDIARTRIVDQSAREYAFYSIVEPGRFIVDGYGNAMYNQYDENLAPQDIADLIAYLLNL